MNVEAEYEFERYGVEGLALKTLPRHRILFGAKWEETDYREVWADIYFPKEVQFFLHLPENVFHHEAESRREELCAFFGEWKWSPHPRLRLNLGGRYEHFEAFGGEFSPYFAGMASFPGRSPSPYLLPRLPERPICLPGHDLLSRRGVLLPPPAQRSVHPLPAPAPRAPLDFLGHPFLPVAPGSGASRPHRLSPLPSHGPLGGDRSGDRTALSRPPGSRPF